jgi:uncharacterized membrane protein YfcA
VSPLALLVATVAMFSGAVVQGSIGFGLNLLAAPILVLIDPHYAPVPVIVVSLVLNSLLIRRNRHPHAWRGMRWPMVGALPTMVAGAAAVALISTHDLSIAFALLLLAAVAVSASGRHPAHTTRNLLVAGAASGFMGTTTGVGGPPMGLLYQHHPGPQLRASLLRFFLYTSVVSLVLLAAFGQVHAEDLGLSARLLPGALAGYLAAPHLVRLVDRGYVRHAVLAISTASAVVVLVKAL